MSARFQNRAPVDLERPGAERAQRLAGHREANGEILNAAERVGVADALALITTGPAWQLHAEHDVGSLRVGAFADLAVFDQDPLAADPAGLGSITTYATYVAGALKYSA